MNATALATIMGVCALPILAGMWFAWRARLRRDRAVPTGQQAPVGRVIAEIPRISYISTTPAGAPFERIALPGLAYRGYAAVTVRTDGLTVTVTGEPSVHVAAADVIRTATARARVGKAVERDGLALLIWRSGDRELESGFRALTSADQHTFTTAIDQIAAHTSDTPRPHPADDPHTTQEDA